MGEHEAGLRPRLIDDVQVDGPKKYNVPLSTIRWHAARYEWNLARCDFQSTVEKKLAESAASKDAAQLLREINRKQLQWDEEMRYAINALLKTRNADGKVVLRADVALNDVSRAIAGMAELYRLDRLALGASTDNVQPATTRDRIDEMSDDEVLIELKRLRGNETVN